MEYGIPRAALAYGWKSRKTVPLSEKCQQAVTKTSLGPGPDIKAGH